MSKIVEIPNDRKPFVVIVNGVKYVYPAGESVEVPDSVADVIEKYMNAKPKPDPNAGGSGCPDGGGSGGTSEEWIGDGNTHLWITLPEGRTSPMLGCCPNGTVTVDWGDGTTPDVLTGTSTSTVVWTPTHNYAKPGDYIITLTVDGEMGFYGKNGTHAYAGILRYSENGSGINSAYRNALHRVEIGNGVRSIGKYAFSYCYSLASIKIPNSVTSIGASAFNSCYSLASIDIPNSVTSIDYYAFNSCYSLASIKIPNSVTSIGDSAFSSCWSLASINIPNSVTTLGNGVFLDCGSAGYYDFTNHQVVPTLGNTNVFQYIPSDCEIRVPAALYDQWIAATNWTTYASQIVAV